MGFRWILTKKVLFRTKKSLSLKVAKNPWEGHFSSDKYEAGLNLSETLLNFKNEPHWEVQS